MELTTYARPYASAAFEYAQANKKISQWADMLLLCATVSNYGVMKDFFSHRFISGADQASKLLNVCQDALSQDMINFIYVLSEKKRLNLLPFIYNLFEQYQLKQKNSKKAFIKSAFPLTIKESKILIKKLEVHFECSLLTHIEIDKKLIGGITVTIGDLMIDNSIRGHLEKLADAMAS